MAQLLEQPAIIPQPQKLERKAGVFEFRVAGDGASAIFAEGFAQDTSHYLAAQLRRAMGCEVPVRNKTGKAVPDGNILLTAGGSSSNAESYELTISSGGVVVRAGDDAGIFYGVQTLMQLALRPAIGKPVGVRRFPCVHIEDVPRFKWRGMMLDVSRHFFSKDEVERLLEAMARYKLNTFHWHLVDDQGWRLEIKKYPRLTEMGAWRGRIGFGLDPKSGTAYGPDGRYGGYYTQEDVREVVAYAAARHITVVPEIEMPGHSSAALMAYPQFSCTGGPFTTDLPGGVFNGVYCAGNEGTFKFLEDVLSEVFELFPGKCVHIGGDEVLTTNWSQCAKCQARMKQEGLKKEIELENYFIRRMEKFIDAHQRTLIGWSEIREGGLGKSAVVMDWVGGATEAASAGHDVVMSPLADCYFDHYQSEDHAAEPYAIGGFLPLRQVYDFEPMPSNLAPQCQAHILGAQANVWTEYMPSLKHVEYMVFPRLCALAEVVWSPKSLRDWNDFNRRLQAHYTMFDRLGLNYRHPAPPGRESSSAR